jgi:Flp pilus assembly pilin Flp
MTKLIIAIVVVGAGWYLSELASKIFDEICESLKTI